MAIKQTLDTRQTLVMTANLQESIKILQYSSTELNSCINNYLELNPFLINQDDEGESLSQENMDQEFEHYGEEDYVSEALYENNLYEEYSKSGMTNDLLDTTESKGISLREYITRQINIDIHSNKDKIIANYLVDMLDDTGYIKVNYNYIIENLKCTLVEINTVLQKLKQFEPTGIFASSLAECLELQLRENGVFDEVFKEILANLELIAQGKIEVVTKKLKISLVDLRDRMKQIKQLNPKPGSIFIDQNINVIYPDVFLKRHGSGYLIELNNKLFPDIKVDKVYYQKVKQQKLHVNSKKFMSEQYNIANWLTNSITHRQHTLLKVVETIVEKQEDFFTYGINSLKSMSMQDVATETNLSISTISRVTTNKYLSTPVGMFELKYFFSSSIGHMDSEENLSSKQAKHLIKKIIDKESIDNILSDNDIVLQLKEYSIEISRRTVAKYREQMKIGSSSGRKRNKKLLCSTD